MKNVLILSSGDIPLFKAIINYFKKRNDITFTLLCNKKNSPIIKEAHKLNIETFQLNKEELRKFFRYKKYDLVVLANFNQILQDETINNNTVLNIHSSLLPKYRTTKAIEKTFLNREQDVGFTIYKPNGKIWEGEIIYQKRIQINPKWDIKEFKREILKQEYYYYPRIINKFLGLNVLVVGSKSSDHAIADKIKNSKYLNKLYLANCNDGFACLGEKINYNNYNNLAKKILENNINLVIVNDEFLFKKEIVDILRKNKTMVLGADKKTAKLENSKYFSKRLLREYDIKTAVCKKITNKNDIEAFMKFFKNPIIKANGLTNGIGIFEDENIEKIKEELHRYLDGKYSNASKTSLIEQRLTGLNATLYSFWDGENILHFPLCQTHKKSIDNLYTSGVGAICPVAINEFNEKKLNKYKEKLETLLKQEKFNNPFIICSELIFCNDDIYTVGFNTRFCDTSGEVLLNYIENDWLELFYSCATKSLNFTILKESFRETTSIIMTSKHYPLATKRNIEIKNISNNENVNNFIKTYFSDIIIRDGQFLSDGGKILSVVSQDRNSILRYLKQVEFEEKEYRNDIVLKPNN